MTTQKTSALVGPALDWAVAKCEGKNGVLHDDVITRYIVVAAPSGVYKGIWQPTVNWSQGGPIIEREGINLGTQRDEPGFRWHPDALWHAQLDIRVYISYGPTPLIAAMRCYVASKLGEEVDIPEGLV